MKRFLCMLLAVMLLPLTVLAYTSPIAEAVAMLRDPAQLDALYARFSPEMQSTLPKASLGGVFSQLEATFGAYQGLLDDYAESAADGYTVCTQTVDMALLDLTCTMALDADGRIAGLNFTLAPVNPAPADTLLATVVEESVTIGEAPWQMPGKLDIPESDHPVPAVVLVHGSGPSDMDETAYAVKPFRDLAAALSREGIAVLRYDKRTYVYGQEIAAGDMTDFTVEEETIRDAIDAGRLLAADPRIDPTRIYVLGHSLGAMLAPRIVAESDGLFCGMILACGTNASLLDVIVQQNMDAAASLSVEERQQVFTVIGLMQNQAAALPGKTAEQVKNQMIAGQCAYYFWEMLQHPTPAEQLKALALPTLIINGSRDFQVSEKLGRQLWEASLDTDAPWLTCLWADVNHMLMRPAVSDEAAGTVAEYAVPCTVDASVTEAICAFINHTEE